MTLKQCVMIAAIFFALPQYCLSRSAFRPADPRFPQITTRWQGDARGYTITNARFRVYPLFGFSMRDFTDDLLPEKIFYRNNAEKFVHRNELDLRIEQAILEIKKYKKNIKKKQQLTYFTVLQDKNFNYKNNCGLIVLRFKEYPFVLKLFMETPQTFVDPHATGFEPTIFFYMGGGTNRHLSGITRIKNLKYITAKISSLPYWKERIELPRKWFWLPKDGKNIEIIGDNIGEQKHYETSIPGTYAIIADAMDFKNQLPMPTLERRRLVMQLCNDLHGYIDPHFDNYIFTPNGPRDFKIMIFDTEHFPTITGLETHKACSNHFTWYFHLAGKCVSDMFLQTKDDLIKSQMIRGELAL